MLRLIDKMRTAKKDPVIRFRVDIIVEPDDDRFHAFAPALQGLHAEGATEDEALKNAGDAVVAYLRSLIKRGDPIPLSPMKEEGSRVENGRSSRSHEGVHGHSREVSMSFT